jgi:membrane-bound serine protease (ClpP class)
MPIWLPVLMFAVGIVALLVELFVPAVGTIGAVGIICMVTATVLGYRNFGTTVGTLFLAGTLVGAPVLVLIGLKMFPKTFVGKKLILGDLQEQAGGPADEDENADRDITGKRGIAVTTLRPSGMVMIGDQKYSVVTLGDMIEQGAEVQVVRVEGARIVVRKAKPVNDKRGTSSE